MTVSFSNGDLHLPNGQAAALLEAVGYPAPIVSTCGNMLVTDAKKGVAAAKLVVQEGTVLHSNILELEDIVNDLADIGVELLEWS
jgi:hypothetical protein